MNPLSDSSEMDLSDRNRTNDYTSIGYEVYTENNRMEMVEEIVRLKAML